jgi:D-glycero-alpha-D-manno-heptose-7-phosphate kinase
MIITRTPFRISLFGGGSDHPKWHEDNFGKVISFTIDKYCYISARVLPPFFEHNFRIAYSKVETTKNIDEIKHPAVREAIREFSPNLNLEIHHDGDLPARSGVGSSSAFAVGIIHALSVLNGKTPSSEFLANRAINLEQEILKENVGSQDQIACSFGGFNTISFGKGKIWSKNKVKISTSRIEDLEDRMVLIYSGIDRISSDISASLIPNILNKKYEMKATVELAIEAEKIIESQQDLNLIGKMLDESWNIKKALNPIAVTKELEDLYLLAKKAGALGGKILGAGGGGFCLFWLPSGAKKRFLSNFKEGTYVPFRIEFEGSKCILK